MTDVFLKYVCGLFVRFKFCFVIENSSGVGIIDFFVNNEVYDSFIVYEYCNVGVTL